MSSSHTKTAELKQQVFAARRSPSKKSRSGAKKTTIAAYSGVFLLVMSIVAIGYQPPQKISNLASVASTEKPTIDKSSDAPSVDQLVATRVAAGVAERAELPIASNVANLSVSLSAESALAQTDNDVISKPKIVKPSADSREMKKYVTKAGDSTEKVASQFGISAQTIKWANNLDSDALKPKQTLSIPPIDGVVYTAKKGDTVKSIASKYKADAEQLIAFNDLELGGLSSGKKLMIPGGNLPKVDRPGYEEPQAPTIYGGYQQQQPATVNSYGSSVNTTLAGSSAGNRYAFGNCTSYAFERRMELGRPIGSFWGNATTWDIFARAAGFKVDRSPEPGAIYQMKAYAAGTGGYGHVGIVESVNPDGSVYVSDMNYAGNFNTITTRTIEAGLASQYNYIH